ncbi:hypothetical protein ACFSQT_38250 [Mesorhizobium calcicola]|uniref:Deacetylase sirtuin-type domain-containing protein n=1 Tax=Mesorhizobium calcicola TaxID=1300310 RepID=A0ABW4WRX0_9HYPH
MHTSSNLVILTSAGISAASGVATFRDLDRAWAKAGVFQLKPVGTLK